MDNHIFETNTNLTDVDTLNFFEELFSNRNVIDTYTPGSAIFSPIVFIIIGFLFIAGLLLIAIVLTKLITKEKVKPEESKFAVLALAGMVAVLGFSMLTKTGPEGKFDVESVLAYNDKDKVSVKDIQGSWLYKHHDFVQKNVKNSDYLKDYDVQCDDEMKIPEQEKRSVFCGGDILSAVLAKEKNSKFDYWLLANFRAYKDDGQFERDPRIAKIKKQEIDEENPIKLSMKLSTVIKKERV